MLGNLIVMEEDETKSCGSLILESPDINLEAINESLQNIIATTDESAIDGPIHVVNDVFIETQSDTPNTLCSEPIVPLSTIPNLSVETQDANDIKSNTIEPAPEASNQEIQQEQPIPEPVSEPSVVELALEASNQDITLASPVPEPTENDIINMNFIKTEIETQHAEKSTASSDITTIGDTTPYSSIIDSITSSVKEDCLEKYINTLLQQLPDNNIGNIVETINSIPGITDMKEIKEPTKYENIIAETNFGNITACLMTGLYKAPEPIINIIEDNIAPYIETDKKVENINLTDGVSINNHVKKLLNNVAKFEQAADNANDTNDEDDRHNNIPHPIVTFSSSELNDIAGIGADFLGNINLNNSSLNTTSEFSYTKKLKHTRQPNLIPNPINKNIRLSPGPGTNKKKHKKQVELDEVDYLYNKLQDYIRYLHINISNYMIVITKAMEIIENYDNFTPTQTHGKKDVVIKALNRLVMVDLDLSEYDKQVVLSTISNFIELIIMCSKRYKRDSSVSAKDTFNNKNDKIDDIVLATSGQIVHSLIDKLTTIIIKNQYNAEKITHNIPTLTEILMLMADKYDYLTGLEKKNIVLQAMDVFIKQKMEHIIELDDDKKHDIIQILQCVPHTIDLFIALQKQKYKINKKYVLKVKKGGCLFSIFGTKPQYDDE